MSYGSNIAYAGASKELEQRLSSMSEPELEHMGQGSVISYNGRTHRRAKRTCDVDSSEAVRGFMELFYKSDIGKMIKSESSGNETIKKYMSGNVSSIDYAVIENGGQKMAIVDGARTEILARLVSRISSLDGKISQADKGSYVRGMRIGIKLAAQAYEDIDDKVTALETMYDACKKKAKKETRGGDQDSARMYETFAKEIERKIKTVKREEKSANQSEYRTPMKRKKKNAKSKAKSKRAA